MPKTTLKAFKSDISDLMEKHDIKDDISIFRKTKTTEKDAFIKVFQNGLEFFIEYLTPAGCKMFMYFMVAAHYGNFVEVDQKKIQEKLKIGRTAVNKALKELQDLKVITILPDLNDKRRNTYMINHYVVWKGNPGDRIKSINKKGFTPLKQLELDLKPDKE